MDPWERDDFILKLQEHFELVAYSMGFAILAGLSLGIIFSRDPLKKYSHIIEYIVGLGQTVPALAILALSMAFFGIGI